MKTLLLFFIFCTLMVQCAIMTAPYADAQTQIAYCKTSKGEIITIAAGSPCPNGSWPL